MLMFQIRQEKPQEKKTKRQVRYELCMRYAFHITDFILKKGIKEAGGEEEHLALLFQLFFFWIIFK